MSTPPGTRLGPYEIEALIGAGGMGEVYRARDARLDRTVAIKVLPRLLVGHPTRQQRFEREARAVSRLSHPNICAVYDVGEQDGVHFIVMEYLAGETLAARLRAGPLSMSDTIRYGVEVAGALDHAHRNGIVHRDLKPANIMLTRSGAKLLDFGIARFEKSDMTTSLSAKPTESLTSEGAVLGTVQYMAPEQVEGREVDARADIFSFGVVLYEMVSGRPPFVGASAASIIAAILEREVPPLTRLRSQTATDSSTGPALIPPLLEHVIARCLAKDPDERWQTAADLRHELKWVAEGSTQMRASAATPAPRRSRARLAWALGIGALAVVGVAFAAFQSGWWRRAAAAPPTFKQLTFRRGNTTQARFAPDGQTILYSAAWDGGPVQMFETRENSPAARPIGPRAAGLAAVSSTNELALLLNCTLDIAACTGTLARMPLSGGAPRPVLEDVADADWTPGGQDLAVVHVYQGESRVEFPIGKRLYGSAGKLQSIAFSPQGDRLAFVEHPILGEEGGDLKVVDLAGKVTTVLSGWKTIRGGRWSPNGDAIWLSGSQKSKDCSLYAVSLSGNFRLLLNAPGDVSLFDVSRDGRLLMSHGPSRSRMIWTDAAGERDLSWLDWSTVADVSVDGKKVLFHEWGTGVEANPVVYMRESIGGDAVRLGDGKALALSPDGSLALALLETPRPKFVLLPTGTGATRSLPPGDLADVWWAKWFPDGRRLLVVSSGADNIPRSHIQDIDTGRRTPLADAGWVAHLVSPKGDDVVIRDPLGTFELRPVAGGAPTPLEGILADDRPIQWSADGRLLYIRGEESDSLRLYRYTIATKHRELWKDLGPRDKAGVVGIATGRGEVAVTPDGKVVVFTYWLVLDELFLVAGVPR